MNPYARAWASNLTEKLFQPEIRHFHNQIDGLIEENDRLLGQRSDGFHYRGKNYGRGGMRVVRTPSLDLQLAPKMSKLLAFQKSVEHDRHMIRQVIFKLLEPCQSLQQIRDALPESLVSLDPLLASHQREQEPGWPLKDRPRDLRQFEKFVEKIETYSAMRYLY